jgi:type VI secretion system secreted protein Hcp
MKMKLSTLLALTPAAIAALAPPPVEAATSYFLKLEGIPGDSADKLHKEWIELQGWSFGVTAESSWSKGGGASVGKPVAGPAAVTASLSKASPVLYSYLSQGKVIPSATLAVSRTTSSSSATDYYTVKLENVYLTSAKTGGATGDGGLPAESITMVYKTANWSYSVLDSKGAVSGKPVSFTYDFVDGKAK